MLIDRNYDRFIIYIYVCVCIVEFDIECSINFKIRFYIGRI